MQIYYMSAGFIGRHVVVFWDVGIDIFLEVQDKKYSSILYLIGYIAYGLHLLYKIQIFKEICRKPIPLHPGLGSSLFTLFDVGSFLQNTKIICKSLPTPIGGFSMLLNPPKYNIGQNILKIDNFYNHISKSLELS